MRLATFAASLLSALLLAGCQSEPRVQPLPQSAWEGTASPRTTYPRTPYRNVEPRRAVSAEPLSRDQVIDLAVNRDPQEAIAEIDRHPLAFKLDDKSIGWFEDRLAPPEVIDYLKKRSQVDWDALRKSGETNPPALAQGRSDDYPPAQGYPESKTVVVERPSTVVYQYSATWDPYWGWGYWDYYPYPYYSYSYYRTRSCAPYYGGTTYYYGTSNPVVVTTPNTTTTYRQGVVVGTASPPAGLYNPRGFVRSGGTTTVVRGGSNPTVVVTRGGR